MVPVEIHDQLPARADRRDDLLRLLSQTSRDSQFPHSASVEHRGAAYDQPQADKADAITSAVGPTGEA